MLVLEIKLVFFFFFFSSRRRHTRLVSDWSSDVCSSDLGTKVQGVVVDHNGKRLGEARGRTPVEGGPAAVVAEIGRASCRERVWIWVGAGWLKKKKTGEKHMKRGRESCGRRAREPVEPWG